MIIMIIYAAISFLLDGLFSNFIAFSLDSPSLFRTIFTVIALVIMFNFFDNDKKYLSILLILGILYDVVYTNTFLLNIFLFLVIYFILDKINYFMPNNLFTINVKTILMISIYHVFTYLILIISNYNYYPIKMLWNILYHSIITTIIYSSISYLLIKKLYFKIFDKKIK